jgi:WhiB family redox-sensing transcriptional regulator
MYATSNIDTLANTPTLDPTTFSAGTNLDREPLTRETVDRVFDELVQADEQPDAPIAAPVTLRAPQARCADGHGTLSQLFFSDDVLDIARAKAICSKCKLAASCLDGALDRAEPWGVWGGELIENGRIVVHKRPRGRPPKHPRPIVVIDECPIPTHLVA